MKKILKYFLFRRGYKINKINKNRLLNDNPFLGVQSKIGSNPIIFDVGANQGQTILKIKSLFPDSDLHSFEPSKICFKELSEKFGNKEGLVLNNVAVGAEEGTLEFNEYYWSALNSFLKRAYSKSGIIDTYFVDIVAVDDYCREKDIPYIHLLKTDTEGFELNVLKGASEMMGKNKIQFVFVEVFFYENYIGQSSFGDVYNFLLEKGFTMVRFYDFEYTDDGYASRTDALFINEKF
jgi:FkbM family methyltransferase